MPTIIRENLPRRAVKLTITVSAEEMSPDLVRATERLSEHVQIPGFRSGHATYEAVKSHVGEMKILEEALEEIVRKTLVEATDSEKIETVGSPSINVEKMAPDNDLVYTAELALMPVVEKLADYKTLSVKAKDASVKDEDIDKTLVELQKMRRVEVRSGADATATKEDKTVIDLVMKKNGVVVEGGTAKNYQVYLSEPHYISGFADELLGMKEAGTKIFTIPFPKEHYQKHLAGENVEFEVTLNELYHLELPVLDDVFATMLGQKNLDSLKTVLRANMTDEKSREEALRQEREMLSLIANRSRFSEMPDLLVNQEVNKMVQELEHAIEEKGGKFDDYLSSIKKTLAQLKLDITPQAIERIKVTLVIRELGKQMELGVSEQEMDTALDELVAQYPDKESKDRIYSVEYREYIKIAQRNKKVVEKLRETMVK
ncbi:MAG: trigger factor [Patescibacteria group bacterium]